VKPEMKIHLVSLKTFSRLCGFIRFRILVARSDSSDSSALKPLIVVLSKRKGYFKNTIYERSTFKIGALPQ